MKMQNYSKSIEYFTFILFFIFCCCDISVVSTTQPKRVVDQMYISFDRVRYCVRRLNGTHEIGCQSESSGNSGRMLMIDNRTEFETFIKDDEKIQSFSSLIVVLNANLFHPMYIDRLMTRLEKKLNGLLLYIKSNETRPESYSHDDQCPNRRENFYLDQTPIEWNPYGTGLFFRSFPFPIMFIDEQDDYQRLVEFYTKFQTSPTSPMCGLELKAFQNAAHDTKTCMRRNDISHSLIDIQETFCDPIGGLNIYGKISPGLQSLLPIQPKSIILIIARTDSFQMFLKTKGGTGGTKEPGIALITFLALAHFIGQAQDELRLQNKELIFVTLDGDAMDYSASFKFMFDMKNNYFPNGDSSEARINLEHIHSVIELFSLSMTDKLWLHTYPKTLTNETFIEQLIANNPMINLISNDSSLPPASSQIFLRESNSSYFPVYILSSTNRTQLSNKYYHSFFDDLSTVGINVTNLEYNATTPLSQWIKKLVEPLGQTLINSLVGPIKNFTIDQLIINNLVYCTLKNINCPLISNVTNQSVANTFQSFDEISMPFSINTYPTSSSPTFVFVQNVLGYFLRDRSFDHRNLSNADCQELAKNESSRTYNYVPGYPPSIDSNSLYPNYCIRSYLRSAQSMSPAFVIEKYDLAQTTFPTWTESRWSTVSLRLFIIPSRTHEILTLIIGLVLLLVSFLLLLLLRTYTKISLLQPSSS